MRSLGMLRRLVVAWLRDHRQFREPRLPRTCPICGYHGVFIGVGHPPRWDARCLGCGSRERHRLTHLWITEGGGDRLAGKRILHSMRELFRPLKRDGVAALSVPINASRRETYENPLLTIARKPAV